MRSRWLVIPGSAVLSICALGIDACSSDDSAPAATPDASEASPRDGTIHVLDADPTCDPSADLFANVKDASIGDGASTTGLCASCIRAQCSAAIMACASDCPCNRIVGGALDCYLSTQQIGCLGGLADYLVPEHSRDVARELAGCARTSCASECAIDAGVEIEAGADADTDAAEDAAQDAADDGG